MSTENQGGDTSSAQGPAPDRIDWPQRDPDGPWNTLLTVDGVLSEEAMTALILEALVLAALKDPNIGPWPGLTQQQLSARIEKIREHVTHMVKAAMVGQMLLDERLAEFIWRYLPDGNVMISFTWVRDSIYEDLGGGYQWGEPLGGGGGWSWGGGGGGGGDGLKWGEDIPDDATPSGPKRWGDHFEGGPSEEGSGKETTIEDSGSQIVGGCLPTWRFVLQNELFENVFNLITSTQSRGIDLRATLSQNASVFKQFIRIV